MAHTASGTASILSNLYEENFGGDFSEPFRLTWPELRAIIGVSKLKEIHITKINNALSENNLYLLPFNNFLLVAKEQDLRKHRQVPGRLLEQNLYDAAEELEKEDIELDDDDVEAV
ncbi:MAG: hypothetical protein WCP33_06955 [Deltaproteobacteria bacterium]